MLSLHLLCKQKRSVTQILFPQAWNKQDLVFGWKTNFLYGLGNFPDLVEALGTLLSGTKYILIFLKAHRLSCFNANLVNSVEGFEKLLIVFQGATFSQEKIPNHTPYTFFPSTYTLFKLFYYATMEFMTVGKKKSQILNRAVLQEFLMASLFLNNIFLLN